MRPPELRPSRSIGSELWHFQYFPTWQPSAILNFKNFNIWSCDCHWGHNLLLCTKFQLQTPITAEYTMRCAVARQRPLPWQPHHGGHVGNMMGCDHPSCAVARQRLLPWQPQHGGHVEYMMGCAHPSCVPVGQLVGEIWHFKYFPTRRPSAILNFENV